MKNYTDITVLLDTAGSMSSIKTAMESGFKEFVDMHKKVDTTKLTLIQFDTVNPLDITYEAKPISTVHALDLTPRGGTPLLDALCRAIDTTGSRLRDMKEYDRPNKVLMVIITDGQENASTEFKRTDVKARIQKQSGDYNWQFVYLGANQDAFAEAASFGINKGMTMWYDCNRIATADMMRSVSLNTFNYAQDQNMNSVQSFTTSQRAGAAEKDPKDIKPV